MQFAQLLYNILDDMQATNGPVADYIITGVWSEKAHQEAQRLLPSSRINTVVSTRSTNHNGCLPPVESWTWQTQEQARKHVPAFVYYCDNETVHGVEWPNSLGPMGHAPEWYKNVPVICDMSSNFLSRPVDVSKYVFSLFYDERS
jgi:phosphoserine aminotransferase